MRTSTEAVQAILGGNWDGETSLTPFIEAASSLVDDLIACAEEDEETVSATKAELIERWLAAHFYAAMDPSVKSESTDGASVSYEGKEEAGLGETRYGRRALSLDTSGCLVTLSSGVRASISWLGKADPDKANYDARN